MTRALFHEQTKRKKLYTARPWKVVYRPTWRKIMGSYETREAAEQGRERFKKNTFIDEHDLHVEEGNLD